MDSLKSFEKANILNGDADNKNIHTKKKKR